MAKPDAPGEEGIEAAREQDQKQKQQQKKPPPPKVAPSPARPRQDSLDLQRASGEGMTAPPSNR